MPIYKTLTESEQDDLIVQTYKSNEKDLFVHLINKDRFEDMLQTLGESDFKTRIEKLLIDTNSRIIEVQSVLDSTDKQLPDNTRVADSLVRIKSREV